MSLDDVRVVAGGGSIHAARWNQHDAPRSRRDARRGGSARRERVTAKRRATRSRHGVSPRRRPYLNPEPQAAPTRAQRAVPAGTAVGTPSVAIREGVLERAGGDSRPRGRSRVDACLRGDRAPGRRATRRANERDAVPRARACVNFRARAVATANGWFRPDVVVLPVDKSRHPPRRAPEGAQTHTTERVEDPRERVARASAEVSERVRATSARSTSATRPGPEERGARIPRSDPLARLDADRGWRPHCSRRWPAG